MEVLDLLDPKDCFNLHVECRQEKAVVLTLLVYFIVATSPLLGLMFYDTLRGMGGRILYHKLRGCPET